MPLTITIRFTPALPCTACGKEAFVATAEPCTLPGPLPDPRESGVLGWFIQPMCAECVEQMAQRYEQPDDDFTA